MINYCIPTYRSFEHCRSAIIAASNSSLPPDQYIVIDNSGNGSVRSYVEDLPNVHIWPQSYNLGVAQSFNVFMQQLEDYTIIANDDVFVHPHTIEALITAANDNPQDIFFAGSGHSGNAFSLFLLRKKGFLEIGPFDKRFYPGYFEDNDYAYRMLLKGYKIHVVESATYEHIGSSTIKTYTQEMMQQHHHDFNRNAQYYFNKWGGKPTEERYREAFNGEV